MTSPIPVYSPGSYTYRFVGKPLYWALSQLNPFGTSSTVIEKEDVLWKKYGKGKEYVHMPLLEVCPSHFYDLS
jgi:charged multivesicular body protein 7